MNLSKFSDRSVAASDSFNNLLDHFFTPMPSILYDRLPATAGRSLVPVNVREAENGFEVDVIAPGFVKEDFKIQLEEKTLTVSAEKKSENTVKYLRNEYKTSSFKRSFKVDENIDATQVSAQYVNGVLTLNLPKRAEVKPSVKQIVIQ
jgi:HSP20 family protein